MCLVYFLQSFTMLEGNTIVFGGLNARMSLAIVQNHFVCWETQCLFGGIADMAKKLSAMSLTHVEVALFCAVVILLGKSNKHITSKHS